MPSYDEKILEHYKEVAFNEGDSSTSTMADERARALETEVILSALDYVFKQSGVPLAQLKVADVGCGNGYTLEILRQRYPQMQFSHHLISYMVFFVLLPLHQKLSLSYLEFLSSQQP